MRPNRCLSARGSLAPSDTEQRNGLNVIVANVIARARGTSALLGPIDQRRIEGVNISNVQMQMPAENTPTNGQRTRCAPKASAD